MRPAILAAVLLAASSAHAADSSPVTVVACAPGYPGSTAEAQPGMDALAAATAKSAGWPPGSVRAVYEPTEKEGLARLGQRDAAVALVPLPFLVAHGKPLDLEPRLQVVPQDGGPTEVWTLVAKKGRVASPAALAGFTIYSVAGYAPAFVRGAVAGWGRIPDTVPVAQSTQVLSTLRKAASGADVAVLLDGAQSEAFPSLPFASDLEVVARSAPLPGAFVATVGKRLPPARWAALQKALVSLPATPDGAAALEGIRTARFVPADPAAVATARKLAGTK